MLVLSRKKDEVILVGHDVRITVVEFRGDNKVRLGVQAPKAMPVHRQEVYDAIYPDGQTETDEPVRGNASLELAEEYVREAIATVYDSTAMHVAVAGMETCDCLPLSVRVGDDMWRLSSTTISRFRFNNVVARYVKD